MTQVQTATAPLNPAQKAWLTRRARAAESHRVIPTQVESATPAIVNRWSDAVLPVARLYIEPEIVPATEFQFVELWLDDITVGCGQRRFTVLGMSGKRVQLFYAPRLITITVDRSAFDRGHVPARKVNRRTIADIIRKNIALADRVNQAHEAEVMPDGGRDAQRVLELLAQPARKPH